MNKMACGWVLAWALLWGNGVAEAANTRGEVRKQVEASVLVQGAIDIEPDGRVAGYQIDQQKALTPAMVAAIDPIIRAWRFEPVLVDGKAVRARSPMGLRLVARPDGDNFKLRIAGVNFGRTDEDNDESPSARGKLERPAYPSEAVYDGVGGVVYLVVRIGRDGTVEDVIAEQVNLRAVGTELEMERYRKLLTAAAMKVARRWRFNYPTRGEDADKPFISARVPVDFIHSARPEEKVGEWIAYVPGPRQSVPWRNWDAAMQAPDAIAAGGIYPDRPTGPKLLSGLDG